MITPPSPSYSTEEAKRLGAQPVFRFSFINDAGSTLYTVLQSEIADGGEGNLQEPLQFDLVSGENTLILYDKLGKFNPHSGSFILSGNWWISTLVKIEFGWGQNGGITPDAYITLYIGRILRWGPRPEEIDPKEGQRKIPLVEIYSRDHIYTLLQGQFGAPDDNGVPIPAAYGSFVRQADECKAYNPFPSDVINGYSVADFETGGLGQPSAIVTGGSGAVAIISPGYSGTYGARCTVNGTNATAWVEMISPSHPGSTKRILGVAMMKVVTRPATPAANSTRIFGTRESSGEHGWSAFPDNDTRLMIKRNKAGNITWDSTNFFLSQFDGQYFQVEVALVGEKPGLFKIFINGNEIYSDTVNKADFRDFDAYGVFWGPDTSTPGENWVIDVDDLRIWGSYEPYLYQIPGGAVQSIDGFYIDGSVQEQIIKRRGKRQRKIDRKLHHKIKARKVGTPLYVTYPTYGAAAWQDFANPPSGSVFLKVTKNAITHPVDIIQAIITAAGLSGIIDSASFAAAKSAISGYTIGAYFEDTTYGDAIKEILQKCLITVWIDYGKIFARAYTGSPPGSADLTLTDADVTIYPPAIDRDELIGRVTVKWSWWDNINFYYVPNLVYFYKVDNNTIINAVGKSTEDIDFTWGEAVCSDNQAMCQDVAAKMLKRIQGPREICDTLGTFASKMRVELGDILSYASLYWRIYAKNPKYGPRDFSLRLGLIRFMGE